MRYGIVCRVWGVNPNSVLQSSDHQPFLPGLPCYSLERCEDRGVVRKNKVCFLLHCFLHYLLGEVVSEEQGLHSVRRAWFHQQPHIVPAFSQGEGSKVVQSRNELPEIHKGARRQAARNTDARQRSAHQLQHAGTCRGGR